MSALQTAWQSAQKSRRVDENIFAAKLLFHDRAGDGMLNKASVRFTQIWTRNSIRLIFAGFHAEGFG